MSNFNAGYNMNPFNCKPDCPNRNPYCHNVTTCEQYRKFREYHEMTEENRKKYLRDYNYTMTNIMDAKKRGKRER